MVVDVVVVVVSYKLKQQLTEKQYAIDLNLPGHMSMLQMYSSGEVVHENCCHLKTIYKGDAEKVPLEYFSNVDFTSSKVSHNYHDNPHEK